MPSTELAPGTTGESSPTKGAVKERGANRTSGPRDPAITKGDPLRGASVILQGCLLRPVARGCQ